MRAQKRGLQSMPADGGGLRIQYFQQVPPLLEEGWVEEYRQAVVRLCDSPQFCKVAGTYGSAPINCRAVVSRRSTHAHGASDSDEKGLDLGRLRCC